MCEQPFVDADHPLHALFPPRVWAIRIPVILILLGSTVVGSFLSGTSRGASFSWFEVSFAILAAFRLRGLRSARVYKGFSAQRSSCWAIDWPSSTEKLDPQRGKTQIRASTTQTATHSLLHHEQDALRDRRVSARTPRTFEIDALCFLPVLCARTVQSLAFNSTLHHLHQSFRLEP